ncbi:hypothetical protein [Flavipsychrobacter stenotrophus]|nr:hypothetical protein [Flavipsychrobacter stenotrophus]
MHRFLLTIALIICFSTLAHAQGMSNSIPQVKLANVDSAHTTFATILTNPRLTTGLPNCKVTEFTISFTIKDGKTFGPYPTHGNMLTDEQKIVLKNIRNEHVRILVERINIRCDEQDFQPKNIVLDF